MYGLLLRKSRRGHGVYCEWNRLLCQFGCVAAQLYYGGLSRGVGNAFLYCTLCICSDGASWCTPIRSGSNGTYYSLSLHSQSHRRRHGRSSVHNILLQVSLFRHGISGLDTSHKNGRGSAAKTLTSPLSLPLHAWQSPGIQPARKRACTVSLTGTVYCGAMEKVCCTHFAIPSGPPSKSTVRIRSAAMTAFS